MLPRTDAHGLHLRGLVLHAAVAAGCAGGAGRCVRLHARETYYRADRRAVAGG